MKKNPIERQEVLHEMGISPYWVLRASPAVNRQNWQAPAPLPKPKFPPQPQLSEPKNIQPLAVQSLAAQSLAPESLNADSPATAQKPLVPAKSPANLSAPNAVVTRSHSNTEIATLDWLAVHEQVSACRACGLCATRQQAVFGVGDKAADWLFIGDAPDAEEDEDGEPFAGKNGQLLDAMLSAIGLARGENVYLSNALKCYAPDHTPNNPEILACRPFLERQIALVNPRVIILLGRVAVHTLLGLEDSLASLRGKPLSYLSGTREIPVVVSYHPAYLLRSLPDKIKAWEDLCRARALLRSAHQTAEINSV